MLHKLTSPEVAEQLRKLTDASYTQRYGDHQTVRDWAEQAYKQIYTWLEEHGVRFEYDQTQARYLEVSDD